VSAADIDVVERLSGRRSSAWPVSGLRRGVNLIGEHTDYNDG
jgi:hypothetical protein